MSEIAVAARPESAGIDSGRLDSLFARARDEVERGRLQGCQVAVARQGQLAGFACFGAVPHDDGLTRPVAPDTLFTIFSSTKAVVGVAAWTLFEDGLLQFGERVADIIPEFGTNGKDAVTVEQTLCHIGGFPSAPFAPTDWDDRERRLARFARWGLNWEPGSQFTYHPSSAHWVLAEVIERRTGEDFRAYVRRRILDPIGSRDLYVGLPATEDRRVAKVSYTEPPAPPPGGWGEVTPEAIFNLNLPEGRRIGMPGGAGVATAAGVALFYQVLANGGVGANGVRILAPETIDFATTPRTDDRHRDPVFGHPVNRAITVVVAGDDGLAAKRGFGANTSGRAFGHAGAGGQVAWCDPESGLSFCFLTNSFVPDDELRARTEVLSTLAGACLL